MRKVSYRRSGGAEPADEELLEIDDAGGFTMARLVSVDRVGRFGGRLDDEQLRRLDGVLGAVDGELDIAPQHAGSALEIINAGSVYAACAFEAELPQEWDRLREVLRELLEELKDQPVAALEATVDDAADEIRLRVTGGESIDVSFDGSEIDVALFDEDGGDGGSARLPFPSQPSGTQTLEPGWHLDVPLRHGLAFSPQRMLKLSLVLAIDDEPGELVVYAGKVWS